MSKKIEIRKVVIQIGEQEANLTIEQARDLKDALTELLGTKEKDIVYIPQPYPVPYYQRPYWRVVYGDVYTTGGTNTWGKDSGSITYSLENGLST